MTEPAARRRIADAPEPAPGPVITDRWHHTSDGAKVPALMGMTHTSMSHRAYMERPAQDAPPSVKIGMLVACQADRANAQWHRTASEVRGLPRLAAAMNQLLAALTDIGPGMSWKNLAGNGPRTLEAALTAADNPLDDVPAASALFLPSAPGESLYGRNGRAATLILYIEPRTADGHVPPAADLAAWHERFRLALQYRKPSLISSRTTSGLPPPMTRQPSWASGSSPPSR